MSEVLHRRQHEGALPTLETGTCIVQLTEDFIECLDVDLVCGISDEDVVEVCTQMRETLEEAVHGPLKNGWSRRNSEG